jgi:hypothetical protein
MAREGSEDDQRRNAYDHVLTAERCTQTRKRKRVMACTTVPMLPTDVESVLSEANGSDSDGGFSKLPQPYRVWSRLRRMHHGMLCLQVTPHSPHSAFARDREETSKMLSRLLADPSVAVVESAQTFERKLADLYGAAAVACPLHGDLPFRQSYDEMRLAMHLHHAEQLYRQFVKRKREVGREVREDSQLHELTLKWHQHHTEAARLELQWARHLRLRLHVFTFDPKTSQRAGPLATTARVQFVETGDPAIITVIPQAESLLKQRAEAHQTFLALCHVNPNAELGKNPPLFRAADAWHRANVTIAKMVYDYAQKRLALAKGS